MEKNSKNNKRTRMFIPDSRVVCVNTYLSGGYGFLPNWSMTGPPPLTMRSNQPSSLVIVNPSLGNVVETLTPINPMPDSVTT